MEGVNNTCSSRSCLSRSMHVHSPGQLALQLKPTFVRPSGIDDVVASLHYSVRTDTTYGDKRSSTIARHERAN